MNQEAPTRRGKFISLEGGEGVGKSTQVKALAAALRDRGIQVVETREPGGSEGAEKIRALLLDHDEDWSPRSEALLFAAARSDHVEDVGSRVVTGSMKASFCWSFRGPWADLFAGLIVVLRGARRQ